MLKMNIKNKISASFFAATAVLFGLLFAPSAGSQQPAGFAVAGERFDSVMIGTSTADHVIAAYGENYKLIDHRGYSYEMIYKDLGLGFYYCQNDPNREIFVVEIEAPSKTVTDKGIVLGKSTLADVLKIYGEPTVLSGPQLEYDGISFFDSEDTEDEDDEDARTKPAVTEKKETVNKENPYGLVINPEAGYESNFILDGQEVVDGQEVAASRKSVVTVMNGTVTETGAKEATRRKTELKKKIVRRIELFEKPELRQCDQKFPKR